MAEPGYRFLPWTRRGLAAGITAPDASGAASRAVVSVGITVSGAGDAGTQMRLYGPGDIVGIDPRLIVRMEPRPGATDVEPNYVAAIEFDPPDFPWLFTPTAPTPDQRLRPWCTLVVVDSGTVDPPHLERGMPLPVIDIPSASVITELPDLAESWAWAHTQVLTTQTSPDALRAELKGAPDRQLSRLLCPRRLEPSRHYCACVVPAFAVGVVRGLGGVPAEDATLAPAWSLAGAQNVRLPVYYHWEFATGPQGDFESLARALKPFKVDAGSIGSEAMFVGDAGSGLPQLAPDDATATMLQDGALRAPLLASGTLEDVPAALVDGLENVLNVAAARLDDGAGGDALGPPLYGEWHADRHSVDDDSPAWFRALNLDPRARVAAGLGAEVVRANQEAFMHTCWEQVGKVLDANEALNRARLSLEAGRRVHERHFKALPADLVAQIASPLHARVKLGATTVRSAIATTSTPDATTDVAMRRLTSGQRPVLKKLARRQGDALPPSQSARPLLARTLAAGRADVDPGRFTPGGVLDLEFLSRVQPTSGTVDLTPVGVPMTITADEFALLDRRFADLAAVPTRTTPPIKLRANLASTGVFTGEHLAGVAAVSTESPGRIVDGRALVGDLLRASVEQPGAVAFLVTVGSRSGESRVDAVDVDSNGNVSVRPGPGTTTGTVGTVSRTLAGTSNARLGDTIARLPPDTLDRRGREIVEVKPAGTTDPPIRTTTGTTLGSRTTSTLAPPDRTPTTIKRFETAFTAASKSLGLTRSEPALTLVQLSLATVRGSILEQTDPVRVVRLRTAARVRVAGQRLDRVTRPGLTVAPTFDRIMVAPSIVTPLYELLADYDRTRLLPGVDRIPDESITLLETNPRFVTAFLAGANHEMNRELLWRRYPTDQRGTTLQRFWDWIDDGDDVPAIHTWNPSIALGGHARGGAGGLLVLLVRGKLLRRYPNSVIYAWRAVGRKLKDPPTDADLRPPVFGGHFAPDITFVGFDLSFEEITHGDGWFFVIQQQPTEPRFGFDEDPPEFPAVPPTWSDATWSDADVAPGRHLTLAGSPLTNVTRSGATFGRDAAHLAAVLLQKPMRVALHGSQLAELR